MSSEYWLVYEIATGAEKWRGSGRDGEAAAQQVPDGYGLIMISAESFTLPADEMPIEEIRAALWKLVKARREARLDAGAMTPFGVIQTDLEGRVNIAGAALAAKLMVDLGQPFTVTLTLADNSEPTLDGPQMIQLGLGVVGFVSGCHDRARALRDAIGSAATVAEALSIDIASGWPA